MLSEIKEFIIEQRGSLIILLTFVIVSELSGNSVLTIIYTLLKFFTFPITVMIFGYSYSRLAIPEVFFLLLPLTFIFITGFIYTIVSEE